MRKIAVKIKNTFHVLMSTLNTSKEDISELEDRKTEITQTEAQRAERVKQKQNRASLHQDNIKQYNIRIVGIPGGKERENLAKEIFLKIMAKNFLKLTNAQQQIQKLRDQQTGKYQKARSKQNKI